MTNLAVPPKTLLYEFFAPATRKMVVAQVVWFGLWLVATGIGLWLRPDPHGHGTHQQLGLSPCPSVLFFSRPCPGCGLTTSWTSLLHGNIGQAFASHWFGPFLYLGFTIVAFASLYGFLKNMRIRGESLLLNRIIIVAAVIFFGYGFSRMALVNHYAAPHENLIRELRMGRAFGI